MLPPSPPQQPELAGNGAYRRECDAAILLRKWIDLKIKESDRKEVLNGSVWLTTIGFKESIGRSVRGCPSRHRTINIIYKYLSPQLSGTLPAKPRPGTCDIFDQLSDVCSILMRPLPDTSIPRQRRTPAIPVWRLLNTFCLEVETFWHISIAILHVVFHFHNGASSSKYFLAHFCDSLTHLALLFTF